MEDRASRKDGMIKKSLRVKELIAFDQGCGDLVESVRRASVYQLISVSVWPLMMMLGVYAYFVQFNLGLAATNMSDIVSWGFYIANFTFLVGVAAAAVMIILPPISSRTRTCTRW